MAQKTKIQKAALGVTGWVGSLQSIVLHTIVFSASFIAVYVGAVSFDRMLLVLTTLVSLEAIYLAIFIQMTINIQQAALDEVEQDIDEIQGDIDEIQEDVDEIAEDVDEIAEDVEEIIEDDKQDEAREQADHKTLEEIRGALGSLMQDIERLQNKK
jgi:peptidoglycan hydrolase CwlO-like protein